MTRPRIALTVSAGEGITSAIEKVGRGYVDVLAAAGGLPVLLPTLDPSLAAEALADVDGLLLTGGGDVEPSRYGALAEPETSDVNPARDAWELALVAVARAGGLPILGICRGAQVIDVAYGGTLIQHLSTSDDDPSDPSDPSDDFDHFDLGRAAHEVHDVAVVDGCRLRAIVGAGSVRANTIHHQSVGEVGPGLVVTARSADGTIEAIESEVPTERVLGVQWHPELLADRPPHRALFEWLVTEAGRA